MVDGQFWYGLEVYYVFSDQCSCYRKKYFRLLEGIIIDQ